MSQGKTDEELREQLLENLKTYSKMNEHFRLMLLRRARSEDWLECPLVQLILNKDNSEENLKMIEDRLETISKYNSILVSLPKGLLGDEKEFDVQLTDYLAELHGLERLVNSKYFDIKRIPTGLRKTPDFSAGKGDLAYLFEVKNFRDPFELMNLLLDKLEARKLRYPDSYGIGDFQFEIDPKLRFRRIDDKDIPDINLLFRTVDSFVSDEVLFKKGGIYELRGVRCKYKLDEQAFGMASYRTGLNMGSRYKFDRLMPLAGKTWEKIQKAATQLFDYDPHDDRQKIIMINWMKPPYYITNNDLMEKYRSIMSLYDAILKTVNPKLGVWLL